MFEQAIEKKREKMIYFAERYGMTSQRTVDCSQELDRLLNVICHVHTDLHLLKRSTHTRNNACVSFISKNTHFIGNAHTIVEKKILKTKGVLYASYGRTYSYRQYWIKWYFSYWRCICD